MATTPTGAQRNVKGAQKNTKPASLDRLPQRQATHAVTGPPSMPVTGKPVTVPSGPPPHHRTGAHEVKPKEQR